MFCKECGRFSTVVSLIGLDGLVLLVNLVVLVLLVDLVILVNLVILVLLVSLVVLVNLVILANLVLLVNLASLVKLVSLAQQPCVLVNFPPYYFLLTTFSLLLSPSQKQPLLLPSFHPSVCARAG